MEIPYQRALFYGDTLFETIRVMNGRIPLLEAHLDRLWEGFFRAGYQQPAHWTYAFFEEKIKEVAPANARVRLTVYRTGAGLYFPEDNQCDYVITWSALDSELPVWLEKGLLAGFCGRTRLPIDEFSGLKSLNGPRYVQAAIETKANLWDEGILLNSLDRVCEATSSNIFWFRKNVLCTVPLSEGCVAGVMRDFILQNALELDIETQESAITPDELLGTDEVFLTNAIRGMVPVRQLTTKTYETRRSAELYRKIIPLLSI